MACIDNGAVLMEKDWPSSTRQRRPVFSDLARWVAEEAGRWDRIDRLAVGVGPGAFSGLRLAVSLIRGLSLPDGRPVTAVSSARALARSVLEKTGAARAVVLGDARRNELWAGCFAIRDGIVELQGGWVVESADRLSDTLKMPGSIWVTPDWDRIGAVLEKHCPDGVSLIRESRVPRASMVAGMAQDLAERGMAGEEPVPIYVHPAVSVAPRFPGE